MKKLLAILLLLVAPTIAEPSVAGANGPIKKMHRNHRVVHKTTGIANARAHGGKAYAKGHRAHLNNGNHVAGGPNKGQNNRPNKGY